MQQDVAVEDAFGEFLISSGQFHGVLITNLVAGPMAPKGFD